MGAETRIVAGLLLLAAGCASSARYTVPAAILNTAVAVGAAAGQRASGGCYANCTNGTACNPRTGYCEPVSAQEVCAEAEGGGMRCVPLPAPLGAERKAEPQPSGGLAPSAGVSPATGSVPPPPAKASPRTP
jgi:hypothetical protein